MFQQSKKNLCYLFNSSLLLIVLSTSQLLGQIDSIEYQVGTMFSTATQAYLPHWITANRFGILNDEEHNVGLLRGKIQSSYKITKNLSFGAGIDAIAKQPFIKNQSTSLFFQQTFAKLKYGPFELTSGRIERTLGTHAEGISSGSLALSGNTRPIPYILLEVPDYEPVPFTKEFVKFKGTYGHGWLGEGEERFVKGAYLHEKSLYLKFGGNFKINFSAGLIHFVTWGGNYPSVGKLPSGFKDYVRLILGKSAEGVDLTNPILLGEASNALGNNLGIYDFGLYTNLKNIVILLYHQTPFEDWTGSRLFKNRDRLLGLNVKNKSRNKVVLNVVYEFLYTKWQSGPGIPGGPGDPPGDSGYGFPYGGRDNYYNNAIYKTGWVYQGRVIGTPLFFTEARTQLYFPGFKEPDRSGFDFNIVNNRIVAHHIGIEGNLKYFNYKFLSTFTKNFGTYGGINGGINKWGSIEDPDALYAFRPPKSQNYFLLELSSHPFSNNWTLTTAIAWDMGELSRNFGILAGIKKNGILKINRRKE